MIDARPLRIPEVLEITPKRHGDARGFFSEVWSAEAYAAVGLTATFVQDNHSFSAAQGVLRGLHYQAPPVPQGKLVRCIRGRILDVAVDIRHGSPTFGEWVSLEVSAERWNQIWVPEGFGHGFVTLEPDCEVLYKTTGPYSPAHDRAIRFDDPTIGIDWGVAANTLTLSDKDRNAPLLSEVTLEFRYRESFR